MKMVLCSVLLAHLKILNESLQVNEKRVYYSLAVWWFKPILSASLRFHSHFIWRFTVKTLSCSCWKS